MKKTVIYVLTLLFIQTSFGQVLHPVKWSYGKKRTGKDTYEIHLKAMVDEGWHIYAQHQPDNAVAKPTRIVFASNNGTKLIGPIQELGTLEKWEDKSTGIGANQYAKVVDFIQIIQLSNQNVRSISGTITFQTCTNKMCLPPEDISFSIPIK